MRTVVLLGFWSVADAINHAWHGGDELVVGFLVWVLRAAIVMDIVDFLRGRRDG